MSMASTLMPLSSRRTKVLVVDGSPVDQRLAEGLIEKNGWQALTAAGPVEALRLLEEEKPAVLLTALSGADGLALIDDVRVRHPLVPVVLLTAPEGEETAIQALQRGAASFVPKKSLLTELADRIEQVLAVAQTDQQSQRLLASLMRVESTFVLDNDRHLVPGLVHYFHEQMARLQLAEQATLVRVSIALEEALLNAMYHGNLEVGSELRQEDDVHYHALAERRRAQPPYRDRRVHLRGTLSRSEAVFVIRDEGPGFDPTRLPDPRDPANLEKTSGRGLLLIQTFMDRVSFSPSGNELTMTKWREWPEPAI